MGTRPTWTPQQLHLLREFYPYLRAAVVARKIGRSVPSVYAMASRLGLDKTGGDQLEVADDLDEQSEEETSMRYLGARYRITVTTQGLPVGITSVRQYRLEGGT